MHKYRPKWHEIVGYTNTTVDIASRYVTLSSVYSLPPLVMNNGDQVQVQDIEADLVPRACIVAIRVGF